jgi:NAD(P)-dependent dehydrogenase (short-subunit alcohol dehydrogenase family)
MDVSGNAVLILGGAGLVGRAVARELLASSPRILTIAARRKSRAEETAAALAAEFPDSTTKIVPAWGDVFLRADWQTEGRNPRAAAMADKKTRQRLIADILDPLDGEITDASFLVQLIEGRPPGLDGTPANIIVDCINTATAVSYQDVYAQAQRLAALARQPGDTADWPEALEGMLASLYVPQLVRHVQLLHEAMRRAGTKAYIKIGTSGTGGMGFNIPYTHGEEKPSRLLLSKAAMAGAQSLLTFLMARTPAGPTIVKEIKPAAVIGWREIGWGPIGARGGEIALYDCSPDDAVAVAEGASLERDGDFGTPTGGRLEGVYIDTGENGLFSAGEFAAITALGQMELVTPEDIARLVMLELGGGNTGRDVVAAIDGALVGPSYRGGYLRQAAIDRLRRLEREHGESVAFEILGPPRLSKLLFEAFLLKQVCTTLAGVLAREPDALAAALEAQVAKDADIRTRTISIGIPILLPDGKRLLRGPHIKSGDAYHGWVDLTPANMSVWQDRVTAMFEMIEHESGDDTSSHSDIELAGAREEGVGERPIDIGRVVAWIFNHEENGQREKD